MKRYVVHEGTSVYVRERRRGAEWEQKTTKKDSEFTWSDVVFSSANSTIFSLPGYIMQVENRAMQRTAMD